MKKILALTLAIALLAVSPALAVGPGCIKNSFNQYNYYGDDVENTYINQQCDRDGGFLYTLSLKMNALYPTFRTTFLPAVDIEYGASTMDFEGETEQFGKVSFRIDPFLWWHNRRNGDV